MATNLYVAEREHGTVQLRDGLETLFAGEVPA
jgi:hypothetical protein